MYYSVFLMQYNQQLVKLAQVRQDVFGSEGMSQLVHRALDMLVGAIDEVAAAHVQAVKHAMRGLGFLSVPAIHFRKGGWLGTSGAHGHELPVGSGSQFLVSVPRRSLAIQRIHRIVVRLDFGEDCFRSTIGL